MTHWIAFVLDLYGLFEEKIRSKETKSMEHI